MRAKSVCEQPLKSARQQKGVTLGWEIYANSKSNTLSPIYMPPPSTTVAVGHSVPLVLVLVADVVGFALKYTVRHEICTCPYN